MPDNRRRDENTAATHQLLPEVVHDAVQPIVLCANFRFLLEVRLRLRLRLCYALHKQGLDLGQAGKEPLARPTAQPARLRTPLPAKSQSTFFNVALCSATSLLSSTAFTSVARKVSSKAVFSCDTTVQAGVSADRPKQPLHKCYESQATAWSAKHGRTSSSRVTKDSFI